MKDNQELLNCPFCGGKAYITEECDYIANINVYYIECCNCKATFLDGNTNKDEEIEKWNRRVNNG